MTIEGGILIHRPIDDVFDCVADERNEPRFNPKMTNVEKLTDGPIGAETLFRATTKSMGRGLDMTIEFTGYDRPFTLASHTTMASTDTTGVLTFTPDADGTRMHWSWDVRPNEVPRFLGPLIDLVGRRQENTIWRRLKRELEAQPTGTGEAAGDDED